MVAFAQTDQAADEKPRYNETVGGAVLADSFKEGPVRGGFAINGVEFRNFEANSPENMVAQINARQAETGVFAELDEGGHLKLSHQSGAPIRIERGAPYQAPARAGETPPEPDKENKVLDAFGLDETTEENDAYRQQTGRGGLVGQVGDGGVVNPSLMTKPNPERTSGFQTAEEIEAQNRRIMQNPRGINPTGARAPHAPHESVPGTVTTGNRPNVEQANSNAERVRVAPGQETALRGQPLRDSSSASTSGSAPQSHQQRSQPVSGAQHGVGQNDEQDMSDEEAEAVPEFKDMTNDDLREYSRTHGVNLQGASKKADIVRAIKKHERKRAKDEAKAHG